MLLERVAEPHAGAILLSGIGESSDAYHMSSPHPQGLGAHSDGGSVGQRRPAATGYRLHQSARHGDAEQRFGRRYRRHRLVRLCHTVQFDQRAIPATRSVQPAVSRR